MKMEIIFLEVELAKDSWGSYPHRTIPSSKNITPINFSLDKNLRKQVLSILDKLTEDLIKEYNIYRNITTSTLIEGVRKEIANMGYFERRKLLKKYKK